MIPKENHSQLPTEPGCYLFKDKEGKVIYIGKAKNLKKRVSSYFNNSIKDPKTQLLKTHIESVDFFITKNEIEALLLENNLIKKTLPKIQYRFKRLKKICLPPINRR